MAKLYKVRKKCLICGNIFYPRYAGSLYCEDCKNRKKEDQKKNVATAKKPVKVKKTVKHKPAKKKAVKRTVKKSSRKASKKR